MFQDSSKICSVPANKSAKRENVQQVILNVSRILAASMNVKRGPNQGMLCYQKKVLNFENFFDGRMEFGREDCNDPPGMYRVGFIT